MEQWRAYNEKFLAITAREQYLIILTGLVAVVFVLFSLLVDTPMQTTAKLQKQVRQMSLANQNTLNSIAIFEQALNDDPDAAVKKEIAQYQAKLSEVDEQLLLLTSDLIDPIQMRHALAKLLKLQKGVKIISFQVLPAKVLQLNDDSEKNEQTAASQNAGTAKQTASAENEPLAVDNLHLYRHGIKIKLQGKYFQLRDYLTQLEQLSWKFFWQEFDYHLIDYPTSELEIEIYSLSIAQEFIGV